MVFGGTALTAALVAALIVAVAWSVALVWWDVNHMRLPDWLTLPAGAIALAGCALEPQGLWGLIWPGIYLLMAFAIPSGVGGGDIKLALPLGIVVAWAGGPVAVLATIVAASLLTVVVVVVAGTAAQGTAGGSIEAGHGPRELSHGPAMLAAAWLVGLTVTWMGAV